MLTWLPVLNPRRPMLPEFSLHRVAEVASAQGDVGSFLQYGVLGLVVVGFVTGWIVPGYHAKNLTQENARLTALFEERVIPLLEQSSTALDRAAQAMDTSAAAHARALAIAEERERSRDRAGQ